MAGNDKQLYKRFNSEQGVTPHDLQALSPPRTFGISPAQSYYRYIDTILNHLIFSTVSKNIRNNFKILLTHSVLLQPQHFW